MQDTVNRLLELFGSGAHAEAERLVSRITLEYPSAAICWKIMGAIHFMSGRYGDAVLPMTRAIHSAPDDPEAHFNLGVVYEALNQTELAANAYLSAIRIRPGYPEAYNNLGNILRIQGKQEAAEAALNEAIKNRPGYLMAQSNLGRCLREAGKLEAARAAYQSALCIQPDYPDAYSNLGVTLRDLGRKDQAFKQFQRAILLGSDLPEACCNLGVTLFDFGELGQASLAYQRALILRPEYAQALNNLGNSLRQQGDVDGADRFFKRALHINPLYQEAHNNSGIIQFERSHPENSVNAYHRALAVAPDYAEAYNNLGISHYTLGNSDQAQKNLTRALAIRPDYPEALNNLGAVFRDQNRFAEAHAAYQQATELRPDYAEAHWNKGLLQLLEGEYETGWRQYEWRFENAQLNNPPKPSPKSVWLGQQPLEGHSILLYAEQGLGDTLQFYRYAQLVRQLGAHVLLEVQPEIQDLLSTQSKAISVFARGADIPDHDWIAPLMSMPLAFATTLNTIPSPTPYLHPDTRVLPRWKAILGPKTRLRIGLVPNGSPFHIEDHRRSIGWDAFSPLLDLPVDFYCLQKHLSEKDTRFLDRHPQVRNLSRAMIGFSDTAAIASMMDIVISVDTSVAHLSAALGTETWVLLPLVPDWRWLMNRNDSPWYSSAVLFRQDARRCWNRVMTNVLNQLESRVESLMHQT